MAGMDRSRATVRDLVARVVPWDEQEATDQARMLEWVDSGAQLFRLAKPATPPQHLAVYAALVDERDMSVMLVNHVLAQAWLFPGGHVDNGEDPRLTVVRELKEELQVSPSFHPAFGDDPLFLTVTHTRGADSHVDATMWFVFAFDRSVSLTPDVREFSATKWMSLADPGLWDQEIFDPGMHRFVAKLASKWPRD